MAIYVNQGTLYTKIPVKIYYRQTIMVKRACSELSVSHHFSPLGSPACNTPKACFSRRSPSAAGAVPVGFTAVELRLWIQGDLEVEPAIEQLFTTPNIRDLAIEIDQMLDGKTSVTTNSHANARLDQPQWVVCPQPRPDAQFRLICFPYAGGGASAFKDWVDATPEHIELCIVQLPGREERLGEPLMTNMAALVDALTHEIVASTDRPFAFLGHSMGAIVSYEVACQLRAKGATQPKHLFVSARAAPHLEGKGEPLRSLGRITSSLNAFTSPTVLCRKRSATAPSYRTCSYPF